MQIGVSSYLRTFQVPRASNFTGVCKIKKKANVGDKYMSVKGNSDDNEFKFSQKDSVSIPMSVYDSL